MDKEAQLKKINTELKVYINEASFISNACRNQLLRMLGREFDIDLPIEDFQNIDVRLFENGNIEMRGDLYSREEELSFEEVLTRYASFQEKADGLLQRRGKSAFPNNDKNNIKNLLIVMVMLTFFIALTIYAIRSFFNGNYIHSLWLLFVVFSWLVPNVRERFQQAFHYIKRKLKK
jgi:hypothetical protein